MEIFDIHHHLGSLNGGSLQEGDGWQDRDYANRVRIMDFNGVSQSAILAATGYIQADGIKDIGEILVHLDIAPEHDSRGVIGLGEPPTVPGMGAISNAVANAIGVRVPTIPITPRRVLAALEGRNA